MSEHSVGESYQARVNYAAYVISNNLPTSRTFDTCFEMYDGRAVAAALMRRAEKNEKLRANMPRYLSMDQCQRDYETYKGRKLSEVSAELIAEGKAEFAAWLAQNDRDRVEREQKA